MKYVALLRGINVGGNSIVKMADLKTTFEKIGFENVTTYINSGNVIFESNESNSEKLETQIEKELEKRFFPIKIVVLSQNELKEVLSKVPKSWKSADLRKYIAFIKKPTKPEDIIKEAQPKKNIDFIDKGPQVVYMSTRIEGITKSNFSKLASKPVYQQITIRNLTTLQKIISKLN